MIKKNLFFFILFFFIFNFKSLFSNDAFYLTAESISNDRKKNIFTASGKVNIKFGKTKLKADKVIYDRVNSDVLAQGNVIIFYENGDVLYADKAKLNENLRSGFIKNIGVLLSNDARLAASSAISQDDKNQTVYKNVLFTNCRTCEKNNKKEILWRLKAKKAKHLKRSKIILYESVYLEFYKIPVLYVPIFYHPDPSVKSKTGLLTPKVSNSSVFGTVYNQPIFFNISNTANLTVNTKFSSKEGFLIGNDYNKISSTSELKLKSSFTRGSKARINEPTKKEFRGHLDLKYYNRVDKNILIGANIKRASDKSYLAKYGFSEGDSVLNQNIFLESGNLYKKMSLDIFKFQSLSQEYTTSNLPFIRPYLNFSWNNLNNNKRKRNYNNKLTINSITRTNKQNVDNINFETNNSKSYMFNNGLLLRNLNLLNIGLYAKNATSNNKSLIKAFPQTGLSLEYPLIENRKKSTLLLEPKAQLFLSPDDYKNYKIRNEDSLDVDLSSSNLYSTNRYSGYDRVESGIRANYGILLENINSNRNNFSAFIGQAFNNNKQQLFNKFSGFGNKTSEMVGNILFKSNNYNLNYDFRFDEELRLNRNTLESNINLDSMSYNISYIQLKNFASTRHNDTEQITYGLNKKLSDNWHFNIKQLRDLAGAKYSYPLKTNLSLQFFNECAFFEVNYIRDKSYNIDIPAVTNLNFRIKLFGF